MSSAFDQRKLRARVRELDREKAEKEGLDDPNEFDNSSFEFQGKTYIVDRAHLEAEEDFKAKMEEKMFDVPRGKGGGLLEQIEDVSSRLETYSKATIGMLENMMKVIETREKPDGKEFVVMTSAAGMRELKSMVDLEGAKREAAGILIREYMAVRREYDMSVFDKAQALEHIDRKHYEITGERIGGTIQEIEKLKAEYPYTEDEAFKIDVNALPTSMQPGDVFEHMGKTGVVMIDRTKYIAGVDPFEVDKDSTPVVPNLGDSPTGKDRKKGFWSRVLGDSTKGMK